MNKIQKTNSQKAGTDAYKLKAKISLRSSNDVILLIVKKTVRNVLVNIFYITVYNVPYVKKNA